VAQNGAMRILLAFIALAACAIAHAQRIDGSSSNVRPQQWRDREDWDEQRRTPEPTPGAAAKQNLDGKKTAPITVVRPVEREEGEERERTRTRKTPEQKPPDAKPQKSTPPSPAEQMQRRMAEEQRLRRGEQANIPGDFRCNAYPVCDRSTGSYGSCRGVEQFYSATSWRDARQQVARDCAAANNPDPCNCARQCSRVAQCGPI
jgi:hypothetical protein